MTNSEMNSDWSIAISLNKTRGIIIVDLKMRYYITFTIRVPYKYTII